MDNKLDIMDTKRIAENIRFPRNPFRMNYKKGCVNGKCFLSHTCSRRGGRLQTSESKSKATRRRMASF